jgi:dTDP-4-dehydrorhamnose 3,5-epimerase
MRAAETSIDGVLVLEPNVFGDERGFFFESWNQSTFKELTGVDSEFVQDNHSRSSKGVLRGLHYQLNSPQGKLVRIVNGHVLDVAVDLRRSSSTFGRYVAVELSAGNRRELWVPEGCAHGFLVLSESADFLYKTTDFYDPTDEYVIRWDDSDLAIDWNLQGVVPSLSEKDSSALPFAEAPKYD